jgi:hypothetical protein
VFVPRFACTAVFAIAVAVTLSGCRMSLTNRVDVRSDGGAVVHVIAAVDDQLYSLAQSQGGANSLFSESGTTESGWTVTRTLLANGDHAIDMSKAVSSVEDVPAAFDSMYKTAASSSSQANMPSISPESWNFTVDRSLGLFTDTIHIHADVPKIIGDSTSSTSDNPWAAAGENLGRAMLVSMLTVNTEVKLPGTVTSTNGERMPDGTIRFTHPLMGTSTIDIVDEVPDTGHIGFAIVLVIVGAGAGGVALVRRSAAARRPIAAATPLGLSHFADGSPVTNATAPAEASPPSQPPAG